MSTKEKRCFRCGEVKPLEEFYRHAGMKDGRKGKCKPCANRDAMRRYYTPHGQQMVKAYQKAYEQTPKRKAAKRRYERQRDPLKRHTTNLTTSAIRYGKLIRKPCEICGDPNSQAHHEDYSQPLAVRWLCFTHHRQAHGQLQTL